MAGVAPEAAVSGPGAGWGAVTSTAPLASSPQWGQNRRSLRMEAQARWKRWEMLPYGRHSMKEP